MRTQFWRLIEWGLLKEDAGPALSFPRLTGRWRNDKAPRTPPPSRRS
jgi:hypothetical protein